MLQLHSILVRIQRGGGRGQGVRTPAPEIHKNIAFPGNIDPDPLKIQKATKPAFNGGPLSTHASETPFSWRFAGGSMMAHY